MPLSHPSAALGRGLAVVAAVVAAALALAALVPAAGVLIWAIALGVIAAPAVRRDPRARAGVAFSARHLLRAGVALLGLGISTAELAEVGVAGLVLAVGTVVLTLALTIGAGHRLGVPRELTLLVAAGSSICGASAVAGMNSVIRAGTEHVGYAVATVTLFGTAAMLLLPAIGPALLGLSPLQTGMWAGASIHEVAQVTAAGAAVSATALKAATIVKLVRVAMLGPAVLALGVLQSRSPDGRRERVRVPGFVLAFLALVAVRSVAGPPQEILTAAAALATTLLAAGLAALGLQIRVGALRDAGWRPLALGLAAWLIAATVGLGLVLAVS